MIIDEYIEMKCISKNLKYFRDLGYDVKLGDTFKAKVEDLSKGSNKRINAKCDICGKETYVIYQSYINNTKEFTLPYTCSDCCTFKNKLTNLQKYGVEHPLKLDEFKDKQKQMVLKKYGTDNIAKTEHFKNKYKATMNKKYGVDNGFQSEEVKSKIKETTLKKYGVEHYRQNEDNKAKYCYGDKCNFYIDGRSYNEYDKSENNERDKWRREVYKRDNFICQVCGDNRGGNLNAHHLNSRNKFPEQRFLLENGITLCKDCHKNFHMAYGFGDNTREQFEEFLLRIKCNDYPIWE